MREYNKTFMGADCPYCRSNDFYVHISDEKIKAECIECGFGFDMNEYEVAK